VRDPTNGVECDSSSLWARGFARSRQQAEAIAKMRRSMFQVRDQDSRLLGTAVLWWPSRPSPDGVFLTAAHVVEGRDSLVLYADSSRDPVPAHVWAHTAEEEQLLLERSLAKSWGTHCEPVTCRHDPDLAIVFSSSAPESAQPADIIAYGSDRLFPAGTEVLCGGYPLPEVEGEGQWEAIFMETMIGGTYPRQRDRGPAHHKYVLGPVVSKGMSGGPVFSPEDGGLIGIVTDALPYEELGHGWSLATPVPRQVWDGKGGLEVT